jgi:hypothetical protein
MWFWPNCVLTDYERKHVSLYKDGSKPGVLRRVYRLQLATPAQPDQNIPQVVTISKIQIARRSRVFAITFGGNLDSWRLTVRNTNGTVYTNPTPRTNKAPIVSSLIVGSMQSAAALGYDTVTYGIPLFNSGATGNLRTVQSYGSAYGPIDNEETISLVTQNRQNFPWLIEPNWVLQPNESLIFEGVDASPTYTDYSGEGGNVPTKLNQILNIAFFAWEFPGMGK